MQTFMQKITDRSAHVSVIGLGYVGLPLAIGFAQAGYQVTGIDTDPQKVAGIQAGISHVQDICSTELQQVVHSGHLRATHDFSVLAEVDSVSICVPTPLGKTKDPDISYIVSVTEAIRERLHPGQLIVLESTTYPGTTDEVLLPRLASTGLQVGHDFCLAFSPERIDPGNTMFRLANTPKILGGVTPQCTQAAMYLYQEVIDAAATKPFGFMPFYPGPGLGGHCIPLDPHYLAWKLKTLDYRARFIELADDINTNMPHWVVTRVADVLNDVQKSIKGSKILVLGVAYKADTNDLRESPALDVLRLLQAKGSEVFFHDPFITEVDISGVYSTELSDRMLNWADCVVITTNHSTYNYDSIVAQARLIVDTRNATRHVKEGREKIYKL